MSEGRRYGKNRIGPMGYHWLVALLVFSAEITCAEFTASDSANLAQIESFVGVISLDTGSTFTELSVIRPRVVSVEQHAKYILDALAGNPVGVPNINNTNNIYSRVGVISSVIDSASRRYSEGGKTLGALAVTNTHESVMLNKIYQALTNKALYSSSVYTNYYIPMDTSMFFASGSYSSATQLQNLYYNDFFSQIVSFYQDVSSGVGTEDLGNVFGDLYFRYGSWQWDAMQSLYQLNLDELIGPESITNEFFERVRSTLYGSKGRRLREVYTSSYYNQYAVLPLRNMVSNFLYSAYHNGTLDPKILAQLANPDEVNALVSSSQVSNSIGNVVGALKYTGLVGTNDVYSGTYETNGVLAEITTNDYHNSGYSAFANNMSSNAIASKITSFNFDQRFEEGLKPFLDEISAGSGSDWIINFGNITLGDFSYTIPAVTLQRNTVYLSYVDRAFGIMKAISTVCFFLLLWNTLVAASKDG